MITITMNVTESQFKDLQTLGKVFGDKSDDIHTNVITSISRALQFIRFLGAYKTKNFEIFAVDTTSAELLPGTVVKEKLALVGTTRSIVNINKEVEQIMVIEDQIKDCNGFGLPIDPIPC